jgi:nucleoside 2-deoxyribosyltransferase
MKIYLAGHDQTEARTVAQSLRIEGHSIVSKWLQSSFASTDSYCLADRIQIAFDDVRQVQACDVLVLLEPDPIVRVPGGKFIEVGVALGLNKRVFVVGPRANMLMYHPLITQVGNADELCNELRE